MEHVTIVSDISQDPKTLKATYCVKAIHDGRTVTYRGKFKHPNTTTLLEPWANYIGLYSFISTNTLPPGSTVSCYCDMLGYVNKQRSKLPWGTMRQNIDRLSVSHGITIKFFYIGAETNGSPLKRTYNRCHKEALNKLRGR